MSGSTLVLALDDVERLVAPRLRDRAEAIACRTDGTDLHLEFTGLRLSTWLPRCAATLRLSATITHDQVLSVGYRVAIDGLAGAMLAAAQRLGGGRLVAQWLVDALGARAGLRTCGDTSLEIALADLGWPAWCRIDRVVLRADPPTLACVFSVIDATPTSGDQPCPA